MNCTFRSISRGRCEWEGRGGGGVWSGGRGGGGTSRIRENRWAMRHYHPHTFILQHKYIYTCLRVQFFLLFYVHNGYRINNR